MTTTLMAVPIYFKGKEMVRRKKTPTVWDFLHILPAKSKKAPWMKYPCFMSTMKTAGAGISDMAYRTEESTGLTARWLIMCWKPCMGL